MVNNLPLPTLQRGRPSLTNPPRPTVFVMYDGRVMYSLAATLYHALTGHVPFEAPSIEEVLAAHVHTPVTPPMLVVPGITQPTSDALMRAMAKLPAERFPTYDDFIMALTAARSHLLVQHFRNQERGPGAPPKPTVAKSWWRR